VAFAISQTFLTVSLSLWIFDLSLTPDSSRRKRCRFPYGSIQYYSSPRDVRVCRIRAWSW
jgi:hypothetical protein